MNSFIGDGTRAAIICAFHNGNAGMFSVDMAACQFMNKIGMPFDLFVGQTKHKDGYHKYGGLDFKTVRKQEDLKEYSHVIYWGDFINNPIYGKGGFSHQDIALGNSKNNVEAYDAWKAVMMPNRHALPDSKFISVSNNFQGVDKIVSPDEALSLSNYFYEGFDYIFPRDPLSLESLTTLYPKVSPQKIIQGIDAAYLWDGRNEFDIQTTRENTYFSYFFGRSKIENIDKLLSSVERATGLEAKPLSGWLSCRPNPRNLMKDFISQISESSFVISDTYHCCVNTMNIGTPVISLGKATNEQKGTLGDHKKKILFDMFGLGDRYVEISSPNISSKELENIVEITIKLSRDGQRSTEFDRLNAKKAVYFETLRDHILS